MREYSMFFFHVNLLIFTSFSCRLFDKHLKRKLVTNRDEQNLPPEDQGELPEPEAMDVDDVRSSQDDSVSLEMEELNARRSPTASTTPLPRETCSSWCSSSDDDDETTLGGSSTGTSSSSGPASSSGFGEASSVTSGGGTPLRKTTLTNEVGMLTLATGTRPKTKRQAGGRNL